MAMQETGSEALTSWCFCPTQAIASSITNTCHHKPHPQPTSSLACSTLIKFTGQTVPRRVQWGGVVWPGLGGHLEAAKRGALLHNVLVQNDVQDACRLPSAQVEEGAAVLGYDTR